VQAEQGLTLSPQATAVIEQLWNYFNANGERELEGEHDYNFRIEGNHLLIVPKDNFGEVVAAMIPKRLKYLFSLLLRKGVESKL
jgi:hypothetical protein